MPAIVDHPARRRSVTRIAARLIARSGLAGANIRAIAGEARCSTAVVSHYFHNKRELLLSTYLFAMEETVELARRRHRRGCSLSRCVEAMMPIDRRRRDNWKVWFAFWGMAMSDPSMTAEQRLRSREARALFAELIANSECLAEANQRDEKARRLVVFVSGMATQATYDPEDWPSSRQRSLLAAELKALGLESGELDRMSNPVLNSHFAIPDC